MLLGSGSDQVQFNLGDGWDTLSNDGTANNPDATVNFGQNISRLDVWFEQSGDDLALHLGNSQEGTTLSGWFANQQSVGDFKLSDGEVLQA